MKAETDNRYDVFISCKSEDYKNGKRIHDFLSKNGVKSFISCCERHNMPKDEYLKVISETLEKSDNLILYTSSKEYPNTEFVRFEWSSFLNEILSGRKSGNIITILKDVKVADLPFALRGRESFEYKKYQEGILNYVKPKDEILKPIPKPKKHAALIVALSIISVLLLAFLLVPNKEERTIPTAIDMGLSVHWATSNLSTPQSGKDSYYSMWEDCTKDSYNAGNYSPKTDSDAASVIWGEEWRLPTLDEFYELIENCSWDWQKVDNCEGYIATSKKNGAKLFFPAAGMAINEKIVRKGREGYYWTSTVCDTSSSEVHIINFSSSNTPESFDRSYPWHGMSIRPVKKPTSN